MILLTGAAGFIGSCMAARLNESGVRNLVLCDDFSRPDKVANWQYKACAERVERDLLPEWLAQKGTQLQAVIHLGARTDTTETQTALFETLNLKPSKLLWDFCTRQQIPFIYASSAATYGDGSQGFDDNHADIQTLAPLNAYGDSKHQFDLWALAQTEAPPTWVGLKFFNVYGPNEYHKGRMASVIFHAFAQIRDRQQLRLFRSHRPDFADGGQMRDFVYVKDVCEVILFALERSLPSGIYNLGSGKARSFLDLGKAVFQAMQVPEQIEFIDTPADIRATYQYFTEANIDKLRNAGYSRPFVPLEEGISDYVQMYLKPGMYR
ncbi:MAG: ADP-glyceromanno-heptose 6-epimerase [Bacteroidetes bacterium]|nr:MAG: ADP-glyceromanno-heptose 6-epimerase [Bacteroidota bacterium]